MKTNSWFIFLLIACACAPKKKNLFQEQDPVNTHITFSNNLVETNEKNVLNYVYFYNGGGVATGDLNNDGLVDIVFTGNQVPNKLYLNKGNFLFEDITERSGIAKFKGWNSGVSLVDINADGWLDIYICRSADENANMRKNLLFINNKDNTFTERATTYGLDDAGYSTQAAFFDYDRDGDLDVFILNHSIHRFALDNELSNLRTQKDTLYGSKLYQNNQGHFKNVSDKAGIISNIISFGLGVAIGDVNNDLWPDIYVSNDFKEQDYLYINKGDGKFENQIEKRIDHISLFSMGSDLQDVNNDAALDLITLDMLPEDHERLQVTSGAENFDKFKLLHQAGFHWQYMRNMFHLNDGTGKFSEIACLSGIANSDWSWSPLFADFNNDGYKDIFVTNGFVRDYTNMDFIKFVSENQYNPDEKEKFSSMISLIKQMPSSNIENRVYKNNGNLQFIDQNKNWGIVKKGVSSGASYADLDNDGDLDFVINNINEVATIYKNNANEIEKNNFLRVKLIGDKNNTQAVGSKVFVYTNNTKQYQEQYVSRGYESSVEPTLHFGLGTHTQADSLVIQWNDGSFTQLNNQLANQTIVVKKNDSAKIITASPIDSHIPWLSVVENRIKYEHKENDFNDFKVQNLLPHFLSRFGPCMAKADINGDGFIDVYIGGAKGKAGSLFTQNSKHTFAPFPSEAIRIDSAYEDVDALFFDADHDGDQDLYVVSGGYEFMPDSEGLQDRLYLNNGKGNFSKSMQLPLAITSKSCVKTADFDRDGDLDLFVGGRMISGSYPQSPNSFLFANEGNGKMVDISDKFVGGSKLGMVTDAVWVDLNKDGWNDLIVVGEWMPIRVFINKNGILKDESSTYIKKASTGWWNKIVASDFDKDGDMDFIVGNLGNNTLLKATEKQPVKIVYTDIDKNGSIDPVMTYYVQGKECLLPFLDDLIFQVPILKKKYLYYKNYAAANLEDILGKEYSQAPALIANKFESVILKNNSSTFEVIDLPQQAQFSPVFSIVNNLDLNKDGVEDIILAGNMSQTRIRYGRYDANHGMLFLGDGKCGFNYVPQPVSGLDIRGDVRSHIIIGEYILFGINDQPVQVYRINPMKKLAM